jgi:large subunit ribosomal protein L3
MTPALLGKKVGMTRIYDEKGTIVPVTVVQAGPCAVTQVKTNETDGYNAVQIGFGEVKAKFSTFPMIGHTAKAGLGPMRHFREVQAQGRRATAPRGTASTCRSSTACSSST